jgi:hypothetical protein
MELEGSLLAHKSLPPVPIRGQINPIRILHLYFPKIHFNIMLLCMPKSSVSSSHHPVLKHSHSVFFQ